MRGTANSRTGCLIATLPAEKFGSSAEAYEFLAGFERRIFESGGGDYAFPAQDAVAFLSGRNGLSLAGPAVRPASCRGGSTG